MTRIVILASCVYGSLLVAAIYFTRATSRRVVGAIVGGAVVAFVGAGVEALAHARGWWRYTSDDTPYGPTAMYPVLAVAFSFLALIGWRVLRGLQIPDPARRQVKRAWARNGRGELRLDEWESVPVSAMDLPSPAKGRRACARSGLPLSNPHVDPPR